MLVSALIAQLAANEATKGLADTLGVELKGLEEVDTKDLAGLQGKAEQAEQRATEAQQQITDLNTQVAKLGDDVKGAEDLKKQAEDAQAKVTRYEDEKRQLLREQAFRKAAKERGIKEEALGAAAKLADLSKVEVDLTTGKVSGINDDTIDGLKADHGFLFAEEKPGESATGGASDTIPAPPPAGKDGGSATNPKMSELVWKGVREQAGIK